MSPKSRGRTGLLLLLLVLVLGSLAARARDPRVRTAEAAMLRAAETPLLGLSGAAGRVRGFFADVFRREHLRAQVADLERRLAESESANAALEEARRENDRLQALLALKQQSPSPLRGARVVAADAEGPFRSLVIDIGAEDGVVRDAAVVSPEGLVGRVLKVGAASAVVQLVDDPSSGVGVLVERSRVQGVLVGSGREQCRLKYVPNLEDVKPGDRVLASGLDGIYPKGVLVGRVTAAVKGEDSFLDLRVRPAVSPSRLETVLVFVRPGGTAPAASGLRNGLAEVLSREPTLATLGREDRSR